MKTYEIMAYFAHSDQTSMKLIGIFDKLDVSPLRSTRARAF